jgi:carboxymethylenebutenolidase
MSRTVNLRSRIDDAPFSAYHLQPSGPRRGGVIVLQEIFGVDRHIQADCRRWADLGFEVLAPSLFDRQEPGFTAEHTSEGIEEGFAYARTNGLDNPVHDTETCVYFLRSRGPVFVVGYCYGGSLAYLSACKIDDLAAASCYYGSLIVQHAAHRPLCPTICHFGREDRHIPAEQVAATLRAAQPELPVYLYDAGHGFNNQGGPAYDRTSAELARQRTLELFQQNGAG